MNRILSTLLVIVVSPALSPLAAQQAGEPNPGQSRRAVPPVRAGVGVDGRMNFPPGVPVPPAPAPIIRDPDRRQDHGAWTHAHTLIHAIPHGAGSHNPASAVPRGAAFEGAIPASELRYVPPAKIHLSPPRFTPALSEGGSALAHAAPAMTEGCTTVTRAIAVGKGGGVLAGIGGGITAALGALFGRKKKS